MALRWRCDWRGGELQAKPIHRNYSPRSTLRKVREEDGDMYCKFSPRERARELNGKTGVNVAL